MLFLNVKKTAAIAALTTITACGGTETIDGTVFYDPAEKSEAQVRSEIQRGEYCNGIPLVSIAPEPVIEPNGQAKLTFLCSTAT